MIFRDVLLFMAISLFSICSFAVGQTYKSGAIKISVTAAPDPNGKIFDHQVEHSKLLSYNNVSDVNQVCLALKDHIPIGRHVLSIVATTADNIFISTLLIA